jgi:hypothetical protein
LDDLQALNKQDHYFKIISLLTYYYYENYCVSNPKDGVPEFCGFESQTLPQKQLKQDPNFVNHWIMYADLVQDPENVLSLMCQYKIGTKSALLY